MLTLNKIEFEFEYLKNTPLYIAENVIFVEDWADNISTVENFIALSQDRQHLIDEQQNNNYNDDEEVDREVVAREYLLYNSNVEHIVMAPGEGIGLFQCC